jgi:hypothetical protein
MAKVIHHVPLPPAETFDLIGLTRDEMLGLHALVGSTSGSTAYGLYKVLNSALIGETTFEKLLEERSNRFPNLEGRGQF